MVVCNLLVKSMIVCFRSSCGTSSQPDDAGRDCEVEMQITRIRHCLSQSLEHQALATSLYRK